MYNFNSSTWLFLVWGQAWYKGLTFNHTFLTKKLLLRVHLIVGETCQFFHACQNLTVRKEEGIVFRIHRWEGTGEMTQCYTKYFVCLSRWRFPFVDPRANNDNEFMNLDEISFQWYTYSEFIFPKFKIMYSRQQKILLVLELHLCKKSSYASLPDLWNR